MSFTMEGMRRELAATPEIYFEIEGCLIWLQVSVELRFIGAVKLTIEFHETCSDPIVQPPKNKVPGLFKTILKVVARLWSNCAVRNCASAVSRAFRFSSRRVSASQAFCSGVDFWIPTVHIGLQTDEYFRPFRREQESLQPPCNSEGSQGSREADHSMR